MIWQRSQAGALPADIVVVEERQVGPSLGQDSIEAGALASIIGLALVAIFMIIAYGSFGGFAVGSLVVNIILILGALSGLGATLTLPGIAGIILTIGMAVDANVLVFERIREEARNGRSPMSAVDIGYQQALSTILDANITTLLAAAVLYTLGSPVKGFAVTLAIGIFTSVFTAFVVTRWFIVLWLRGTRPKSCRFRRSHTVDETSSDRDQYRFHVGPDDRVCDFRSGNHPVTRIDSDAGPQFRYRLCGGYAC